VVQVLMLILCVTSTAYKKFTHPTDGAYILVS